MKTPSSSKKRCWATILTLTTGLGVFSCFPLSAAAVEPVVCAPVCTIEPEIAGNSYAMCADMQDGNTSVRCCRWVVDTCETVMCRAQCEGLWQVVDTTCRESKPGEESLRGEMACTQPPCELGDLWAGNKP